MVPVTPAAPGHEATRTTKGMGCSSTIMALKTHPLRRGMTVTGQQFTCHRDGSSAECFHRRSPVSSEKPRGKGRAGPRPDEEGSPHCPRALLEARGAERADL